MKRLMKFPQILMSPSTYLGHLKHNEDVFYSQIFKIFYKKCISRPINKILLPWSRPSYSFPRGWMCIFGWYLCIECKQICPCIIEALLLVNFILSNEITFWVEFHEFPVDGESPCRNVLGFGGGSPAPATIHWELEIFYQLPYMNIFSYFVI